MRSNDAVGNTKRNGVTNEFVNEAITRPRPISLSPYEVGPEDDIHVPDKPVSTTSWVRFHEQAVQVSAEAFEWTDRAVHLRWTESNGRVLTAWVWRGAVAPPDPNLRPDSW